MSNQKKKGFIQLGLVIGFILGSFLLSAMFGSVQRSDQVSSSGESRNVFVKATTEKSDMYRIAFQATGTVQSRADVQIVPQVSGRVVSVSDNVFTGGAFDAEEALFQIEPLDFELEVQRLEAELARAQTALALEQAESKASLQEWKQVNGKKAAPDLVVRKPQMAEAEANVKAAQALLENAKLDLQRTTFSLPFAGRVLSSNLEPGQYVMAGQSYGLVFDRSALEVQVALEDQKLTWLKDALEPNITISGTYLGQDFTAKGLLKRSAAAIDAQTRFATVNIGFKNPDAIMLLPGIFVDVKIEGEAMKNIITLPASALQKDGQIWLIEDDKTLSAFLPDIVYSDDNHIAFRAQGREDVNAVTSRLAGTVEGMRVTVTNTDSTNE